MLANGKFPTGGGYSFGHFRLDLEGRQLYRSSELVSLAPKPFWTLVFLIENRDRVVSINELLEKVWQERREATTVHQAVRRLRMALADDATNPTFIEALPGHGYRFIANVSEFKHADEKPPDAAITTVDTAPQHRKPILIRWQYLTVALITMVGVLLAISRLNKPSPLPKLGNLMRITHSQARILSPLLTDGPRVYYVQLDHNQYSVAEVAAEGGETVKVPVMIPNPELCDLSADGGSLLLRGLDKTLSREGNKPIYIQPLVGGETKRVGEVLAYDAAWDPDAQNILFSADGVVYRCDLNGAAQVKLLTVPGNAFWFRWARGGARFRFTVIDRQTEETSLWEADANGGRARRLFPQWGSTAQQCCGSWTPDGRYFLFQIRDGSNFQIMASYENGGAFFPQKPVQLTSGPMNYRGPLSSHDGTKLFVRTELPKTEIVRFDHVSGRFVTLPPGVSARTADFSKDGQWIAYGSLTDNNLWRCKSDGSQILQLTSDFQQVAMPHWSRGGRSIAFMGRRWGKKWGIFVVGANGGRIESIWASGKSEADPDWSPDDSRLVFGNLLEEPQTTAIYTLHVKDGHVERLPESAGYFSPRWSPDGRFIAAIHISDRRLDVFDIESAKWTNLTKLSCGYPNWSHNGKFLYFLSSPNGKRAVWRVGLANHKAEEVASLSAVDQPPIIFGTWIGLGPDDSPLALRNLTTEDIYAWTFVDR